MDIDDILNMDNDEFDRMLLETEKKLGLVNKKINEKNASRYEILWKLVGLLARKLNNNGTHNVNFFYDDSRDTSRKHCTAFIDIPVPCVFTNSGKNSDYISSIAKYADTYSFELTDDNNFLRVSFTILDVRTN